MFHWVSVRRVIDVNTRLVFIMKCTCFVKDNFPHYVHYSMRILNCLPKWKAPGGFAMDAHKRFKLQMRGWLKIKIGSLWGIKRDHDFNGPARIRLIIRSLGRTLVALIRNQGWYVHPPRGGDSGDGRDGVSETLPCAAHVTICRQERQ